MVTVKLQGSSRPPESYQYLHWYYNFTRFI